MNDIGGDDEVGSVAAVWRILDGRFGDPSGHGVFHALFGIHRANYAMCLSLLIDDGLADSASTAEPAYG